MEVKKDISVEWVEDLRELVWYLDIPSPTVPEYAKHHKDIQQILNFIDKVVCMDITEANIYKLKCLVYSLLRPTVSCPEEQEHNIGMFKIIATIEEVLKC